MTELIILCFFKRNYFAKRNSTLFCFLYFVQELGFLCVYENIDLIANSWMILHYFLWCFDSKLGFSLRIWKYRSENWGLNQFQLVLFFLFCSLFASFAYRKIDLEDEYWTFYVNFYDQFQYLTWTKWLNSIFVKLVNHKAGICPRLWGTRGWLKFISLWVIKS